MVRLDQHKGIKLPSSFRSIIIKRNDSEVTKKILDDFNGMLVVIQDSHYGGYYHSGVLRASKDDKDCYSLIRNEGEKNEERERRHYHDLQSLLVPVLS